MTNNKEIKLLILKFISISIIIVLIINLILLAMRKIDILYFWIIIVVGGLVAFFVVPKLRDRILK
jgi:hypothetical protein